MRPKKKNPYADRNYANAAPIAAWQTNYRNELSEFDNVFHDHVRYQTFF